MILIFPCLLKSMVLALLMNRSSHQRCSVKNGVHRNFVKSTGKCLCQSLFFNKVAGYAYEFFISFLRFSGFGGSFSYKKISYEKSVLDYWMKKWFLKKLAFRCQGNEFNCYLCSISEAYSEPWKIFISQ